MPIGQNQFQFPTAPLKSKYFSEAGDSEVLKWDVISVDDGEKITIVFESVSSPFRQGIWLRCDEGIEIDGVVYPQATLWADTAPTLTKFICRSKEGQLHVYNVWDEGRGRESQTWKSGMRIEMIDDGYRYHCTDAGREINFNTLVFTLTRG